jgi:hypothetical protein
MQGIECMTLLHTSPLAFSILTVASVSAVAMLAAALSLSRSRSFSYSGVHSMHAYVTDSVL